MYQILGYNDVSTHKPMQKYKAIDVIDEIITQIELAKVSTTQMVEDVQRMGFKIKPISGDIATFESIRAQFLKPLWKMGRVDEIVQKYLFQLTEAEQETLFNFLEEFEFKTQDDFNYQLTKRGKNFDKPIRPLRIEVFKDNVESTKLVN